ncbi:hypothetical protein E7811_06705 [Aliigemmobacter aestuarii]|uniref:Sulfotransferase family protein n=1 Tax=Aliigemmobacter aestuarii TaxID=1445661 RepID=A0A4S3MS62_9RHOB|nr:hypothetical protein [Gemmobacter aestuarii]THD85380.1 hypothetical protein E7811_06705 [Gemmobacter aestuarii]
MSRTSALIIRGKPVTEGPRTYIAYGAMRGGTTMVAGVMRGLGIFLGDNLDENNQESADFHDKPVPEMVEAIKRNNEAHDVWGWKFPNAADYADRLWPHLRAPHLICVFRDSVANGQGLNRWHPYGPIPAIQESILRQQRNINLIATRAGAPAILISYEKAERNKREFIEEFSAALGLKADHSKFDFEGFMEASAYKKFDEFVKG